MSSRHRRNSFDDNDSDDDRAAGCFGGGSWRRGSSMLEPSPPPQIIRTLNAQGEKTKITKVRRRRSLEFGLCRHCGERGHASRDCEHRSQLGASPAIPDPQQIHRTKTVTSTVPARPPPPVYIVIPPKRRLKADVECQGMVPKLRKPSVSSPALDPSPSTPSKSSPVDFTSPQITSPLIDISISSTSNRASPLSSSSFRRFPDIEVGESVQMCRSDLSPTVEFPLEVAECVDQDAKMQHIQRWRSYSVSDFKDLDAISKKHSDVTSELHEGGGGRGGMDEGREREYPQSPAESQSEWSDFEKYGIDIDLYVGTSILSQADTRGQSGVQSGFRSSGSGVLGSHHTPTGSVGRARAKRRSLAVTRKEIQEALPEETRNRNVWSPCGSVDLHRNEIGQEPCGQSITGDSCGFRDPNLATAKHSEKSAIPPTSESLKSRSGPGRPLKPKPPLGSDCTFMGLQRQETKRQDISSKSKGWLNRGEHRNNAKGSKVEPSTKSRKGSVVKTLKRWLSGPINVPMDAHRVEGKKN